MLTKLSEKIVKDKATRQASDRQEKSIAKAVGARQVANSGAGMFAKSDVKLDNLFSIECKTKMNPSESISIKKDWIKKNLQDSVFNGTKYSAIAFNFGPNEENYYIIDEYLFKILVSQLSNMNDCDM